MARLGRSFPAKPIIRGVIFSPGGNITTSAAITESSDTSSVTVTASAVTSAAVTELNDTSAATITQVFTSSSSATEANDTSSATVSQVFTSSAAVTEQNDSSSATIAEVITTSAAATEGNDTSSSTITQVLTSASSATELNDTSAGSINVASVVSTSSAAVEGNDTSSSSVTATGVALTDSPGYPSVPEYSADTKEHLRKHAKAINSILQGKMNVVSSVTLTANAAFTTLTDKRITNNSFIGFMPVTSNAAAALSGLYVTDLVSGTGNNLGSAKINHANNAQTDKSFFITILG